MCKCVKSFLEFKIVIINLITNLLYRLWANIYVFNKEKPMLKGKGRKMAFKAKSFYFINVYINYCDRIIIV